MDRLYQTKRLFTHEDGNFFHLHKLLGFLTLLNFTYRLSHWYAHGNLGLDSSYYTLFWIGIHTMLHITSFQFHISSRRNMVYNIIWPEMRWHSMIFAYRSLLVLLLGWLYTSSNNLLIGDKIHLLRGPIVIGTMIFADMVTNHYKNDKTTMRGNPYPSYVSERFIKIHNLFYSTSQIFATMNMLFRGNDMVFLTLIPIQTAPFCMTLVKKGIIDQMSWHVLYTLAVLISYYYGACDGIHVIMFKLLVFFIVFGRFYLKLNKYLLWSFPIAYQIYVVLNHTDWYMNIIIKQNQSVCF